MAKPITPQEMTAYVEATWDKCKKEAWQEQEPVAWAHIEGNEIIAFETDKEECEACKYCVPLYTAPPKREWEELDVNDVMGLIAEHITDPSPELVDELYGLIAGADMLLQEKNGG